MKHLPVPDFLSFRSTCKRIYKEFTIAEYRKTCLPSIPCRLLSFPSSAESPILMDPNLHCSAFLPSPRCNFITSSGTLAFSCSNWILMPQEHMDLYKCKQDGIEYLLPQDDAFNLVDADTIKVFNTIFFYDPFTMDRIDYLLPIVNLDTGLEYHSYGTSAAPGSHDNVVLVGIATKLWEVVIGYYRDGIDEVWNSHVVDNDVGDQDLMFYGGTSAPVYHNGAFYFLSGNGAIGVFELLDDHESGKTKCRWKVHKLPSTLVSKCRCQSYLLECQGKLHSVFLGKGGEWVQVFRLDHDDSNSSVDVIKWVEVQSTGNYTFFVSPPSSISMQALRTEMEDRIFFPFLYGQNIVSYSLKTGKFHPFQNDEGGFNFCHARQLLSATWIQANPSSFQQ